MTDPDSAASPSDERGRTLAQFPLSRVTEVFHDEMLGVLPPAHIRGAAGFFVSEAVAEDIHAQFVQPRWPFLRRLCCAARSGDLDHLGPYRRLRCR
jgi:hypothetical protein